MAEPVPYTYKALYMTREETKHSSNFGLKFVMENKDRWEDISDTTYELQTFDRGITNIVHENKVYMIHRDFVFVDTQERVFLLKHYDAGIDYVEEGTSDSEGTEEEVKEIDYTVIHKEKYDYMDQNKLKDEESEEETPEDSEETEVTE